jgi:DNA-binding XRE family transcriptional regulator
MMKKFSELHKRWMEDPAYAEAYREADKEISVVEALIAARVQAKLSQQELARKIGTSQSAIARLEGGRVSPTLALIERYAEATGSRLVIDTANPHPVSLQQAS